MCLTENGVEEKPLKLVLHLKLSSKIQVKKSFFPGLLCNLILQDVYVLSGELRRLWKSLARFRHGFVNDNSTPWSLVAGIVQ